MSTDTPITADDVEKTAVEFLTNNPDHILLAYINPSFSKEEKEFIQGRLVDIYADLAVFKSIKLHILESEAGFIGKETK